MNDFKKCIAKDNGIVVTAKGRAVFCAVAERFVSKRDKENGQAGEYAVTLIFPPDVDMTDLIEACKAKAKEKWPEKLPGNLKWPVRKCKDVFDQNGDKRYDDELDDWYQIRANTYKARPGVVNVQNVSLSNAAEGEGADEVTARLREEVYSGRWMRISVKPSVYDTDGNRGVKLYLNNVQVLDHDERIGSSGISNPEDDFGAPAATSAKDGGSSDSLFGD